MKRLFLLRAYGDFVIALHSFAKTAPSLLEEQFQLVASEHLKPLYNALLSANAIPPIPVEFVDFGIHQGQINFFTNKHFFKNDTLKQLALIRTYLHHNPNSNGQDYIEQSIRLSGFNFMTQHNFKPIIQNKQAVYSAYTHFLNNKIEEDNIDKLKLIAHKVLNANIQKQILITPDSRLQRKEIPIGKIKEIQNKFESKGHEVKIARFHNMINHPPSIEKAIAYSNFSELVLLIKACDYLISADSLPVHIAQLLGKPHSIVYASVANNFCTPFALNNNTIQFFND